MAMHQLKTGANKIHSNTELLIELQEWSDELQALHSCLTWKQEWNWNGRTSQRLMDLVKSVRKPLADELGKLHKTPFLEKELAFFSLIGRGNSVCCTVYVSLFHFTVFSLFCPSKGLLIEI